MTPRTSTTLLAGPIALVIGASAHATITLDPAVQAFIGSQPGGMTAGDFDGDGDMDLASTTDGPDKISFLMNDGAGNFTAGPIALLPASSSPKELKAADYDGDGDIDLAVILEDFNSVLPVLNQGGMTFLNGTSVAVGNNARGMGIGDLDADGDMDIAVVSRDDNTATVLTNSGAATFTAATLASGAEPRGAAFGDFDADGDLDLAVSCHDDRQVRTYTNTAGTFAAGVTLSTNPQTRPEGVVCADIDNDGDDDIAVANAGGGFELASIYIAAGSLSFSGPFDFATGGIDTSEIAAADLDCDGLVDLVTSHNTSGSMSTLENLGGGLFGPATVAAAGTTPSEIATADLDGDGDLDIAIANRDSNNASIYRNQSCAPSVPGDVDGDGIVGIADLLQVLADWGACSGCAADLNGDGMVDVSDLLEVLGNWS